MSHIGEFDLIGRIAASCRPDGDHSHLEHPSCHSEPGKGSGIVGIGDDCAVLPQRDGVDTLVTTDLLIEDRHFLLNDITPYELGWKSAAVNISDIAAMGGRPTASFLSIALPKHVDVEWVDGFISGFRELSSRFGVPLLGGDTSASPGKLFINVTVLGECPHGQAVLRSGARPGDLVCVTGCLGDSAAGLKLVLERVGGNQQPVQGYDEATRSRQWLREREGPSRKAGRDERSEGLAHHTPEPAEMLIRRHYLPVPRVELGQQLAALPGVHAMMDISDGIASDLRHILKASGSAAEIELKTLPLSDELRAVCAERGWDPFELAVSGGEDYELLFTAAPGIELPEGCTVIGRIVSGDGAIRWIGSDKDFKGFTHF